MVEVEYLEKIGEPYSLKTRKQGRRANISKCKSDQGVSIKGNLNWNNMIIFGRLTVKNINAHAHATDKQKETSLSALMRMEKFMEKENPDKKEVGFFYSNYNFIRSIGISLNKK